MCVQVIDAEAHDKDALTCDSNYASARIACSEGFRDSISIVNGATQKKGHSRHLTTLMKLDESYRFG